MDLPIPENDAVKKAVKWIFSEMEADKELRRRDLVEKASVRFDLSPAETEYLMRASKIKNV
ncbi:MAG: hypothetical protein H6680_03725 [Desulfobacteraceae bacterium]|jgi:ribosomal protein S2|nr:hypothetical protein [Desulfobacteraceae bacterium]